MRDVALFILALAAAGGSATMVGGALYIWRVMRIEERDFQDSL